jgi:putative transposase
MNCWSSSAAWTLQQLPEAIGWEEGYRYLIHNRDKSFGLRVVKSPPQSPMANALCERLIGTIRRECLDWLIPISEAHLRTILKRWAGHYNGARPRMSPGPGVPDPPTTEPVAGPIRESRHRLGVRLVVRAKSVLGGLHHEYSLAPISA